MATELTCLAPVIWYLHCTWHITHNCCCFCPAGLTSLRELALDGNRLTSLAPLAALSGLEVLLAAHNHLSSCEGVQVGRPAPGVLPYICICLHVLGCPASSGWVAAAHSHLSSCEDVQVGRPAPGMYMLANVCICFVRAGGVLQGVVGCCTKPRWHVQGSAGVDSPASGGWTSNC
jgi:hypothetical protein